MVLWNQSILDCIQGFGGAYAIAEALSTPTRIANVLI